MGGSACVKSGGAGGSIDTRQMRGLMQANRYKTGVRHNLPIPVKSGKVSKLSLTSVLCASK
jgi:hypothetical protein